MWVGRAWALALRCAYFRAPIAGRGGGTRFLRSATWRTRTVRLWIAHDTQYWILMKSFGSVYCWYNEASRISRCDEASTMLRTWKRLIALSLGTDRPQFEHRSIAVMPRPCLLRPLLRRLDGIARSVSPLGLE